jgi:hypothetical protein
MKKATTLLISGAMMMASAGAALANEAVDTVRAFYKLADARPMDAAAVRGFFADDFVDHDSEAAEGFADVNTGVYAALAAGAPDSRHELAMVLPSGADKAIVYWRYKGTNTHGLFGMPAMEPPRAFDIAGIEIFEVKDGKFTGMWHVEEIHKLVETLTAPE